MQSVWNLQDAKNKFFEVVNAAIAGTPQVVSRRGQPVVVINYGVKPTGLPVG